MRVPKATGELDERANAAGEDDLLDVIVELELPPNASASLESASQSRAEKIAAQKSAFKEAAQPVAELIAGCGGEVTGEVWLNKTLRARVPARSLPKLGAAGVVSALDVASKVERDH
jgi:hypothetical protein